MEPTTLPQEDATLVRGAQEWCTPTAEPLVPAETAARRAREETARFVCAPSRGRSAAPARRRERGRSRSRSRERGDGDSDGDSGGARNVATAAAAEVAALQHRGSWTKEAVVGLWSFLCGLNRHVRQLPLAQTEDEAAFEHGVEGIPLRVTRKHPPGLLRRVRALQDAHYSLEPVLQELQDGDPDDALALHEFVPTLHALLAATSMPEAQRMATAVALAPKVSQLSAARLETAFGGVCPYVRRVIDATLRNVRGDTAALRRFVSITLHPYAQAAPAAQAALRCMKPLLRRARPGDAKARR